MSTIPDNIASAVRLATNIDIRPRPEAELAIAQRVAAILMRDEHQMNMKQVREALGLTKYKARHLLKPGTRTPALTEALGHAKRVLKGGT